MTYRVPYPRPAGPGRDPSRENGDARDTRRDAGQGRGAEPTADSIVAHCRKHLAPCKASRLVRFVPDLPVNSTGKILRRELHTIDEGA